MPYSCDNAAVDLDSIRARAQALQQEIAQLRADNENYLTMPLRSSLESDAHTRREILLGEILAELSNLTKKKTP
jgi:hypothetical protein